ncbi:hypothetical protein [Streptomyces durbertensis]|uniref:hypothetical protein n=1 Tax=Streptomyces durbertensis TaxID=2448886 RepID=UPI003F69E69A
MTECGIISPRHADKEHDRMTASPDDARDADAPWDETAYLLRSPANAHRLMAAVARDKANATRTPHRLQTPAVAKELAKLPSLANLVSIDREEDRGAVAPHRVEGDD